MALERLFGDSEPVRPASEGATAGEHERRVGRGSRLGAGTLACPRCDAPVAPGTAPLSPTDALACPFCGHDDLVREFLSLTAPARPALVEVRVVARARAQRR